MLLYMAARAQMVDEIIRPALQAGQTVVSDRFLLANIVYQGHAGGLDIQALRQIGDVAVDGVHPDCTFLLDMDPALALKRVDRQLDRVERRGDDYRQRLRAGFLAEAEKIGKTVHRIDGNRSIDAVQAEICQIAAAVLAEP
jgi:dTMP kinase